MNSRRYLFIDVFRGWAVITMIETHAVNAWMDAGLRSTEWFSYVNLVNGFVAPSFLFIAGVAFAFVAESRWEEMIRPGRFLVHQFRRLFMILGIGYLLHIPRIEFDGWVPHFVEQDLAEFYLSDILHTIAVSLILVYAIALAARTKGRFLVAMIFLTVAVWAGTPAMWSVDFHQSLHPAIANYLNGMRNPLFPLLPWCVFLWAGVLISFYFLHHVRLGRETMAVRSIVLAGIGVFVASYLADRSPVQLFSYENFWLTSPNWVLMRLGILLSLFGLFWLLEQRDWHTSSFVRLIGSQSLFAYVVHLTIIYSMTGEKAGFPIFRQDHGVIETVVMFFALLMLMIFLSALWKKGKQIFQNRFRAGRAS